MKPGDTTANQFETSLALANGMVCGIDDLIRLVGKDLQRAVFRHHAGRSRDRSTGMGRHGKLKSAPVVTWRTAVVSASERPVAALLGQELVESTTGTSLRIPEVPVDSIGKIDNRTTDGKEEIARIDEITSLLLANYGHAGPEFARKLLDYSPAALRKMVTDCAKVLSEESQSVGERRAMEAFSLLLVAGHLAVSFGLLPKEIDVVGTVNWAAQHFAARAELDPYEKALDNLKVEIASRMNRSIVESRKADIPAGIDGRYDDEGIYILKGKLGSYIGSGLGEAEFTAWLRKNGGLIERKLKNGGRGSCNYTERAPGLRGAKAYPLDRGWLGLATAGINAGDRVAKIQKEIALLREPQLMKEVKRQQGEEKYKERLATLEAELADAREEAEKEQPAARPDLPRETYMDREKPLDTLERRHSREHKSKKSMTLWYGKMVRAGIWEWVQERRMILSMNANGSRVAHTFTLTPYQSE